MNTNHALSAEQLKNRGQTVSEQFGILESRIGWVTCCRCNEAYSKLLESGICSGCERIGHGVSERDDWFIKKVGKWAFERFRFASFQQGPENEMALAKCKSFHPDIDNLFIHGPAGVGKTHLAYALAQEMFYAGNRIRITNPGSISRDFRKLSGMEEQDQIEIYSDIQVLVIDDFGVAKTTEFLLSIFYEILNRRIMIGRNGLVITSNLDLTQLTKKFGDNRLSSRISGIASVIEVIGADRRMQ